MSSLGHVFDMVLDAILLGCKPVATPIALNSMPVPNLRESLHDPGMYKREIHPHITYPVSVVG